MARGDGTEECQDLNFCRYSSQRVRITLFRLSDEDVVSVYLKLDARVKSAM